jgi:GNAT superfamily N-acetyltransferase
MKPRIVPEHVLRPDEDAAIRAALCLCFPPDREVFSQTRAWHGSRPTWSVLVDDGACIVAHAGIVEREVLFGAERVRVAGIQNVFVLPECRGKGWFQQVMSAAMEEALRRELDLGLLFCSREIAAKYARIEWRLLEGRNVTRINEEGRDEPLPAKNVTMVYPLHRLDTPSGDIHLLGNDW